MHRLPVPAEREEALNEILPDIGVVQASLILDGQQGECLHEGSGEKTGCFPAEAAPAVVDLDPLHAAAGRP